MRDDFESAAATSAVFVMGFVCRVLGERLLVVEVQCEKLRMLYRDSARPPPPPLQTDRRQVNMQAKVE